jgi:hypothetical protein
MQQGRIASSVLTSVGGSATASQHLNGPNANGVATLYRKTSSTWQSCVRVLTSGNAE